MLSILSLFCFFKPKPETNYSNLPPEIRQHILSYCDCITLFKYSQVSKSCDADVTQSIQKHPFDELRFRTYANNRPNEKGKCYVISYYKDGKEHALEFVPKENGKYERRVEKWDGNPLITTHYGDASVEALDVAKKLSKYRALNFYWRLQQFPSSLNVQNSRRLKVKVSKANFANFLTLINHESFKPITLIIETDSRYTLPASFFQSNFFQESRSNLLLAKADISQKDFLGFKKNLDVKGFISSKAVHSKIRQWYESDTHKHPCFQVQTRVSVLDWDVVLKDFTIVKEEPAIHSGKHIWIKRPDNRKAFIECYERTIMFCPNVEIEDRYYDTTYWVEGGNENHLRISNLCLLYCQSYL